MRRPAPALLSEIRHPGPKAADRTPFQRCHAQAVSVDIAEGQPLLAALGSWAEAAGCSSAVFDLAGLCLERFDFVMPDRAIDDRHAAWYSDTHTSAGAQLLEAVAILGRRDGDWFAHIHAYWREDGVDRLGHLLPATLVSADSATLPGQGLQGAAFEATPDPETEFTLFRVCPREAAPGTKPVNALITTLAPFADLHRSVADLAGHLGTPDYEVLGLGSLAGAQFRAGAPMTGLISEILLRPGAGTGNAGDLDLPVRCIDLNGSLHAGSLVPGKAPTLVTCELLIRSRPPA